MTVPVFKNFVSRQDWGARTRGGGDGFTASRVQGLAAHYEAAEEADNHALCAEKVRGIQRYHMDTRRWLDIAYNYLVCGHGYIYEGRSWDFRGAANGSYDANSTHPSVCLLSDDDPDEAEFTAAAQYAFRWLYWRCRERFGHDADEFRPHSSFKATSCPGDEVRRWLSAGAHLLPIDVMAQHVVQAGDSLWSIAKQYYGDGARWQDVQADNNLKSDILRPGQILLIFT